MGTAWLAMGLGLLCGYGPMATRAQQVLPEPNPLHTLVVSERDIRITPRYAGQHVRVRGTVEPGYDVVVVLTSPGRTVTFARMGRVGPIWMAVGRVRVDSLPALYQLKSTRPLRAILGTGEQVRYRLGHRGLQASLQTENGAAARLYLNEVVAAREADGRFVFAEGDVEDRGGEFSTTFFWPPAVPPGTYAIRAFAVRDQRIVGMRSDSVRVHEVGIEALVSTFARSYGVLYGLAAVALAVAIGWLMSRLFDALEQLGALRAWREQDPPRTP